MHDPIVVVLGQALVVHDGQALRGHVASARPRRRPSLRPCIGAGLGPGPSPTCMFIALVPPVRFAC